MNGKLGGYLVGYGITKTNGKTFEVFLDEPIHNKITKHMLNNLLTLDGTDSLAQNLSDVQSMWVSGGSSSRSGVINYAAYGDGTGETDVDDTDLHNRRSEYTSTKKTGGYYCTRKFDNANKKLSIRVSYQFNAASDAVSIKELGVFNKYESSGTYALSARVVLDNAIDINTGDVFFFTYQLDIYFEQVGVITNFGNSGYDLRYVVNQRPQNNPTSWTIDAYNDSFPTLRNGVGNFINGGYVGSGRGVNAKVPIYGINVSIPNSNNVGVVGKVIVPLTSAFTFPAGGFTSDVTVNGTETASSYYLLVDANVSHYTPDSFYRTVTIDCTNLWADNADVYGFMWNGIVAQFGHYDGDTFTPDFIHKDTNKTWRFTFRQSWSTDYLQPNYSV